MDYLFLMQEEHKRLCEKEELYKQTIAGSPEGQLRVSSNGNYKKYYIVKDTKKQYISKENTALIEALAKKKYLLSELKDVQAERRAIELYLKNHKEESRVDDLLKRNDGISVLLKPLLVPRNRKLQEWAEEDYPAYQGFPQDLIHKGPFGKMYRSKTEANIAFLLTKKCIPQRYEWEHIINGTNYPIDFTTRHPKTGKFIYWEHFGKMDDPAYCMKIGPKLLDFESAGIFPGVNLIITFESKQFPMNISQLEEIVTCWYL